MSATPWMKFYPQDWRADEKLRLCSLAARGLWIEMLALMHRSERYGHLLISGHVPTDAQLAVQVGATTPEVSENIGQLEAAGVFSRATGGAIYSRRMTRDEKRAKIARKNGQRGGNPKLREQRGNQPRDNQEDKAGVNGEDKAQRPEARSSDTNVSGEKPPDPSKELWDRGVAILMAAGETDKGARSMLGKWCKAHGEPRTREVVGELDGKANPKAYAEAMFAKPRSDLDGLMHAIDMKYPMAATG